VTAAAGVVLIAAPALIPGTVGVELGDGGVLVPWLLGGTELGIAAISIGAAWLRDGATIRLIAVGFALMHLITALVEVLAVALIPEIDPILWGNVVVRALATVLFAIVAARKHG
jgi:hypothetical protein